MGKEGEDVAHAMIRAGMVESRPHKHLAPNSPMPWPASHELRKVTEKGSYLKLKVEGQGGDTGPVEGDQKAFNDMFQKAAPELPSRKRNVAKEKTDHEKTLASLKVGHRSWDEHVRAQTTLVQKSASRPYVPTKLAEDLQAKIMEGNKIDAKLQEQEVLAANGKTLSASEIEGLNSQLQELCKAKDQGKKLLQRSKSCS